MFLSSNIFIAIIRLSAVLLFIFLSPYSIRAAEFTLAWQDNSNNEDGFNVERGLSESGPFDIISTLGPNSTSYTDSSISQNIKYCYKLTAFNINGNTSSSAVCATHPPVEDGSNQAHGVLHVDFEVYGAGEDPENWKDTERHNSFREDPNLFKTRNVGNTIAFGTDSGDPNIHSHYIGEDALGWTNYIYTGKMFISNTDAGVGPTFFSRYPEELDVYYRLRRYAQSPKFHIAAHGTSVKGDIDSEVSPAADSWYRFHIEVEDTGSQTNIRAKIWKDGEAEPEEFQIIAYDDSGTRITSGTIGVWSMGNGSKLFDDLGVSKLNPDGNEVQVNNPPIASFEMDPSGTALAGKTVTFDASGSIDPDGDPLTYTWDFGDGSNAAGVTASHKFADPGTFEVSLTASDSKLSDTLISTITIDLPANSVPVAVIAVEPGTSALAGETLYFDAGESSDPDGHPLDYTWDFGDGTTATGAEVSHSFSEPGIYEVLLIVDDGQLNDTEIIEIAIEELPQSILVSENFENYEAGKDPDFWMDTVRHNSFREDASLFKTKAVGNNIAFVTDSVDPNIHSHYDGDGALDWTNYIYTGRMFITSTGGGIGVTFNSKFPSGKNVYYRLRRYEQEPKFHIAPHGTSVNGDIDSEVIPVANSWYRFRIEVEDTGAQTNIRAKIWKDGEEEPIEFQIDAYDDSGTRITTGTVGVWSMGKGSKYFDDLQVRPRL